MNDIMYVFKFNTEDAKWAFFFVLWQRFNLLASNVTKSF